MNTLFYCKFLVLLVFPLLVTTSEFVHIRSGSYGEQLVTSNALRWAKATNAKEPVETPSDSPKILCLLGAGLKNIGVVEHEACRVKTYEGEEEDSTSYQLLSGHAARTKWIQWQRPHNPPPGSVALSQNAHRFIAFNPSDGSVGHVDMKLNLGSCVFPSSIETQCLILTEVEPTGYQLTDIELKPAKGFSEEPITLAADTLSYIPPYPESTDKSRTEKVLSYQLENQYDYWGQGNLMAKGLHTTVKIPLPDGSDYEVKIIEWGIPSVLTKDDKTAQVWEDLSYGTAVNVTIHGVRRKGNMNYWANLRTTFKDGSYTTRHIDGQRRVDVIEGITLEKSRTFHLSDGSVVVETTTMRTTSAETTQLLIEQQDMASSQTVTEPVTLEGHTSENLKMSSSGVQTRSLVSIVVLSISFLPSLL